MEEELGMEEQQIKHQKKYLILILLLSVLTLTSCLDVLKQYCPHMFEELYAYEEDIHWKTCKLCGYKKEEEHIFDDGEYVEIDKEFASCERVFATRYFCKICSYNYFSDNEVFTEHVYKSTWSYDEKSHWHDSECGHEVITDKEDHKGGIATCTEAATCDVCGTKYGESLGHSFKNYVYNNDADCVNDGSETAICENGCGEADTRVLSGTKLEHSYTIAYEWLDNNKKVKAVAKCVNGCENEIIEEVDTIYSVILEPSDYIDGKGLFTTKSFNSEVFTTQTKEVVIKYTIINTTGNSNYGYKDLLNHKNGEVLQDFYDILYNASVEFSSNTEDLKTSYDGLYAIETADFGSLNLTSDEAFAVWKVFYMENPSFYWLSNMVYTYGTNLILVIDDSYASYSYRQKCDEAIYEMVQDCKLYIKDAITQTEKAKLIHDFIVNRIDYAYESNGITPETEIWAHNIVGAAKYGYGVCETYSKTYLYLCLLNGVECLVVTGYAGGNHAWNFVCIDDNWYGVDCTWADQSWGITYQFFGISKYEFTDHIPDSSDILNAYFLYNLPTLHYENLEY